MSSKSVSRFRSQSATSSRVARSRSRSAPSSRISRSRSVPSTKKVASFRVSRSRSAPSSKTRTSFHGSRSRSRSGSSRMVARRSLKKKKSKKKQKKKAGLESKLESKSEAAAAAVKLMMRWGKGRALTHPREHWMAKKREGWHLRIDSLTQRFSSLVPADEMEHASIFIMVPFEAVRSVIGDTAVQEALYELLPEGSNVDHMKVLQGLSGSKVHVYNDYFTTPDDDGY